MTLYADFQGDKFKKPKNQNFKYPKTKFWLAVAQ